MLLIGLTVQGVVWTVFQTCELFWDLIPSRDTLIGHTGYLGPFFKYVHEQLTSPDFWRWFLQVSPSVIGFAVGILLLIPHSLCAQIFRRMLK